MKVEHRGQKFSDFLDDLGVRGEIESQAIEEMRADHNRRAIQQEEATKTVVTGRANSSRRAPKQALDPENFAD